MIVEDLRSKREDKWRAAFRRAGKGDLGSLRRVDPQLVEDDSTALASGLRWILDRLDDGQQTLAVGHSPTNEAAVFGLTGVIIQPLGKGEGMVVVEGRSGFDVESPDGG